MDRTGEPFRSAERIRDALRNDRILVIGRIADKGPAVAKSLAEKVRQIAGASDPRSVIATRRLTYRDRIALQTYRDARHCSTSIPARAHLPRRANDSA
jgi:hypothetical protein